MRAACFIIGDFVPMALDVDISISKAIRIVPMFTLCRLAFPNILQTFSERFAPTGLKLGPGKLSSATRPLTYDKRDTSIKDLEK